MEADCNPQQQPMANRLTVSKNMTTKKLSALCGSLVLHYTHHAGKELLPAEEYVPPQGHPWCTVGVLEQREIQFA